jgi:hypothetical protein
MKRLLEFSLLCSRTTALTEQNYTRQNAACNQVSPFVTIFKKQLSG